MSIRNITVHGTLMATAGVILGSAYVNPELNMIATINEVPCVYTIVDGVEAWYPLAKGVDNVTYRHTQTPAADHWIVHHGLGTQDVWFNLRDGDGDFIATTLGVEYDATDPNNIIHFYFATPITGSAFIIGTKAFSAPGINTSEIKLGDNVILNNTGITYNGETILLSDLLNGQQEMTALQAAVTANTSTLTALSARVATDEATVSALSAHVDTVNTTLGGRLTTVEGDQSSLSGRVSAVEASAASSASAVTTQAARLTSDEATLAALSTHVDTVTGTLTSQVATNTNAITALSATVDQHNTDTIARLATDEATTAALTTRVSAVEGTIAGGIGGGVRSVRASFDGQITPTNTQIPWYPPSDAKDLTGVRLQVGTTVATDTTVIAHIQRGNGVEDHPFTLPANQSNVMVPVTITISNSTPITLEITTTGGRDLIVTMEYL